MFNHEDEGMAPMAMTKDGAYILNVDPSHFPIGRINCSGNSDGSGDSDGRGIVTTKADLSKSATQMFALDVFTCCSSKTEQSSVDVNRHITPEVVTTPESEVDANRQILH